jgi:transposase
MLDYKDIVTKHFALGMSGAKIAEHLKVSKSGVNDFLRAFKRCDKIDFPLPEGITNYGIAEIVYGKVSGIGARDTSYELPDFADVHKQINSRKNMTLVYLWNRYVRRCRDEGKKFYQYRQFCELYAKWCDENYETSHFNAIIGQTMEVDFAGKTFELIDKFTGETVPIVVFVAVLPYSQYIYAEGMISTKEPQWIEVNNNALKYFGGAPAIVVCDNCKQAVIANKDWIEPDLNKDYAEWADHNRTAIMPAKVRKPKYKSSVEASVGILEKGIFHDLEERRYFSLNQFNSDLWSGIEKVNKEPFKKKEHNRYYYWEEERLELMALPSTQYQYMERSIAKVSSDFHVRFDNAYYSIDKAYVHKRVSIRATATTVKIYSLAGEFLCEWPRATHKGQWSTDPKHLPPKYSDYAEWNATYFLKKAVGVGPSTVEVIKNVLRSRNLEVQTYRMCIGILNYAKKYSKQILEECCKQAIEVGRPKYSYIKNSIAAVAEDLEGSKSSASLNEEKNRGAFIMDAQKMDVDNLLSRSQSLAHRHGKEVFDE